MDHLYSCNPLRRIAPSPTPAGPAAASGRTYQIKSGRATPGCRACGGRGLRRVVGFGPEIGSASCRERVCQYVEISVVGVSLKKKKYNNQEKKKICEKAQK